MPILQVQEQNMPGLHERYGMLIRNALPDFTPPTIALLTSKCSAPSPTGTNCPAFLHHISARISNVVC